MVVGPELKEPIRSHHDIERDTVKHYKKALKVRPDPSRWFYGLADDVETDLCALSSPAAR